ncbi:MAG: hypothetical protein BWY82_02178 [Verrucomicrobia bacterium ADurb.Bin474]|nr:MAG: hypothetical protein BWY82_02178 [Verrucomicrobia bacterium ADurb.Bin474]
MFHIVIGVPPTDGKPDAESLASGKPQPDLIRDKTQQPLARTCGTHFKGTRPDRLIHAPEWPFRIKIAHYPVSKGTDAKRVLMNPQWICAPQHRHPSVSHPPKNLWFRPEPGTVSIVPCQEHAIRIGTKHSIHRSSPLAGPLSHPPRQNRPTFALLRTLQ